MRILHIGNTEEKLERRYPLQLEEQAQFSRCQSLEDAFAMLEREDPIDWILVEEGILLGAPIGMLRKLLEHQRKIPVALLTTIPPHTLDVVCATEQEKLCTRIFLCTISDSGSIQVCQEEGSSGPMVEYQAKHCIDNQMPQEGSRLIVRYRDRKVAANGRKHDEHERSGDCSVLGQEVS